MIICDTCKKPIRHWQRSKGYVMRFGKDKGKVFYTHARRSCRLF